MHVETQAHWGFVQMESLAWTQETGLEFLALPPLALRQGSGTDLILLRFDGPALSMLLVPWCYQYPWS